MKASIGKADLDALVQSAQTAIDLSAMPVLSLNIKRRRMKYLGREIPLPEREFSILQFFAQQKLKHCKQPERFMCGECRECFLSVLDMDVRKDELLAVRMQFGGIDDAMYERFENAWKGRRAASVNLPEPLRRIGEAVEKVFGADPRAERLMVRNIGPKGHARYGINLGGQVCHCDISFCIQVHSTPHQATFLSSATMRASCPSILHSRAPSLAPPSGELSLLKRVSPGGFTLSPRGPSLAPPFTL
ncbi:MAG: hypothetical protein Q9M27_07595 [Mariprofundaceae bacterium]|nr:hypothetical protein [Mariprofundaceae bacterium]